MKSYTINMAGSGECNEVFAANDREAVRIARDTLGVDVVFAEQWDQAGYNADDQPCKRLLVWASEEDADNDSGANAIAQIETIGQA